MKTLSSSLHLICLSLFLPFPLNLPRERRGREGGWEGEINHTVKSTNYEIELIIILIVVAVKKKKQEEEGKTTSSTASIVDIYIYLFFWFSSSLFFLLAYGFTHCRFSLNNKLSVTVVVGLAQWRTCIIPALLPSPLLLYYFYSVSFPPSPPLSSPSSSSTFFLWLVGTLRAEKNSTYLFHLHIRTSSYVLIFLLTG